MSEREPDELREYLVGLGATAEEIDAAGDLAAALATTIVLRGTGERFSRADAAARAGVPEEMAIRLGRAAGLPDPGPDARIYSEEDVELLQVVDAGAQLLGADAVMQLVRVIGSACARIADAEVAANRSARIVQVAAPSEVLTSAALASALGGSVAYDFLARGTHALRGIREPVELLTLVRR